MLYFSLSVLYTVYFVVHCCDLCGVLMYLFILFQLCRIYNETNLQENQSQHNNLRVFIPISAPGNLNKLFCDFLIDITVGFFITSTNRSKSVLTFPAFLRNTKLYRSKKVCVAI